MFRTLKELGISWLMLAKKTKRVSDAMAEMVESAEGREPMSRMIVVRGQDGEEEHRVQEDRERRREPLIKAVIHNIDRLNHLECAAI
jgi:hypothetical protein